MIFDPPLVEAQLIQRYKRFLADVEFLDGSAATVHVPNTGSMRQCAEPGSRVWLSESDGETRRYRYTLELVERGDVLIAVNTTRTNRIVQEEMERGRLLPLRGYDTIRPEARFHDSRFDFLLERDDERCWVEVKNVTLVSRGVAIFPDAVTQRGRKHLLALSRAAQEGDRAIMLYLVQRSDATSFAPASKIDPDYAETLADVSHLGVEVIAYQSEISTDEIRIARRLECSIR